VLIIVNPTARNHHLDKNWEKIKRQLETGIKSDIEFKFTERREHARELAAAGAKSGQYDIIVAAGGDGTAHEVAMGIFDSGISPQEAPKFMPIPLGSSNDFAKSTEIPFDLDAAISVLNAENSTLINTIKAQGDDQKPDHCINLGQVGLLSVFSYNAAVKREKPIFPFNIPPFSLFVRQGSPTRYTLVALKYILWKYSNLPCKLTIDDQDTREFDLTVFSFGVGKTYGHYPFCPDATFYGDTFATTLGFNLSRRTQLGLISKIKKQQYESLELSEAKKVVVEVDAKIPGGADGEPFAVDASKFTMELDPKSLKIIIP
jgi:diacylglycerol kinase family enzyme